MVLCRNWAQGSCKFGDKCRFEHPPKIIEPQGGRSRDRQPQVTQPTNRYGLFDRVNSGSVPPGPRQQPGRSPARDPRDLRTQNQQSTYGISPAVIETDLRNERPLWIMSAYGPGKDAPIQLFGGPELEQSPEEIRCLHYQALASGNIQQSAQIEAQLAETSNQQVQMVLNDLRGAMQYLQSGENQHPNRLDVCESNTTHVKSNGAFSIITRGYEMREEQKKAQSAQRNSSVQGGFGRPGLGNQSAPVQNGGFGSSPGVGGQTSNPGFGGGFGGQGAFGQQQIQPQAMSGSFGQPQIQPPVPQPGFIGVVGHQQSQLQNGFGGGAQQHFGQQPMQSGMGGINQQPIQNENVPRSQFTLPISNSSFGQQPQPPSLFGQPSGSQPNGMFGQQQPQQSQSAFGTSSSFNSQQNQKSNTSSSGFGGSRPNHVINGVNGASNSDPSLAPATSSDLASYTTRNGNKLQSWKSRPVKELEGGNVPCYQRDDGGLERIWFPDGPPRPFQDSSMEDFDYPEAVVGAYQHLKESGTFRNDLVPELAPRMNMVRWDV